MSGLAAAPITGATTEGATPPTTTRPIRPIRPTTATATATLTTTGRRSGSRSGSTDPASRDLRGRRSPWGRRPLSLRVRRPRPALGRERQDLVTSLGHAHRVLELGGERAVLGDGGPAVGEDLHLEAAGVHHRLYREEHARLQYGPVIGCAEM